MIDEEEVILDEGNVLRKSTGGIWLLVVVSVKFVVKEGLTYLWCSVDTSHEFSILLVSPSPHAQREYNTS